MRCEASSWISIVAGVCLPSGIWREINLHLEARPHRVVDGTLLSLLASALSSTRCTRPAFSSDDSGISVLFGADRPAAPAAGRTRCCCRLALSSTAWHQSSPPHSTTTALAGTPVAATFGRRRPTAGATQSRWRRSSRRRRRRPRARTPRASAPPARRRSAAPPPPWQPTAQQRPSQAHQRDELLDRDGGVDELGHALAARRSRPSRKGADVFVERDHRRAHERVAAGAGTRRTCGRVDRRGRRQALSVQLNSQIAVLFVADAALWAGGRRARRAPCCCCCSSFCGDHAESSLRRAP